MRELQIGDTSEYVRNILAVYGRATDADLTAGRNWYPMAYDIAKNIANGDVVRGAGVLAAFSPMMSWKLNVELAAASIRSNRFTGHFGANNRKARKIWDGREPLRVLGGEKTRAFYQCIVSAGKCDVPVIDRHAAAVAYGYNLSDKELASLKHIRYRTLAEAYKIAAARVGLLPSEIQAIVWVTWRREKGLVD